jgi:hypothetical protein
MKKLLILAFVSCLLGCGNNKQIKLIELFVCTTDGITSDLDVKVIKLKETTQITALDSALYFNFVDRFIKIIYIRDSVKFSYKEDNGVLSDTTFPRKAIDSLYINIDKQLASWNKMKEENLKSLDETKSNLRKIELESLKYSYAYNSVMTNLYKTVLESDEKQKEIIDETLTDLNSAKKYTKYPPETIISRGFDCTYSIFNPVLKIKQTQTQTFYFDKELTKIFSSSGIKK